MAAASALCTCVAGGARAVIHLDTGDPTAYTTTPGDNSGWQYEGQWGAYLGTPIAPFYFLSAQHIGNAGGGTFVFHGETFNVVAGYGDSASDLCLWKVDHAFDTYSPLFLPGAVANAEVGQELRVFGRGTQRGTEMTLDNTVRGWAWGASDAVERWGRNTVAAVAQGGASWFLLQAAFNSPGLPGEAHLSVGDSGGGLFILQNGLWRLAGINYGVDDLYTAPNDSSGFTAAIFDARGYYNRNDDGSFTLVSGSGNVPTSFYSTQVSSRLDWIESIVGAGSFTSLPTENFDQWEHAYFTPDQLADPTITGPGADPDGDGVSNLLEFAFNLDPTCAEPATMTATTGLRGLPLIGLETAPDGSQRLTVEFVRRTAGSGSGITYDTQFTSDLSAADGWQSGGTENVTPINERWERVKVADAGPMGPARFARVVISQTSATVVSRVPTIGAH